MSPFLILLFILGLSFGKGNFSVSGVSSGAYFAVQFHVSHSSIVTGAGIIAGGPFWCAEDTTTVALSACMKYPSLIDLDVLWDATAAAEAVFSIDYTSYLKQSRVWLFSGTLDNVVDPGVMKKLEEYYLNYMTPSSVRSIFNMSAVHCVPTLNYGAACNSFGSPYINDCHFDAAGSILSWILGKNLGSRGTANSSLLVEVDQGKFTPLGVPPADISMAQFAYAYIPEACRNRTASNSCGVHISFHGCQQTTADIGNSYYTYGGWNEWAEAAQLIILYPQVIRKDIPVFNPQGCWDWWGYAGPDYATKPGVQIATVNAMATWVQAQQWPAV